MKPSTIVRIGHPNTSIMTTILSIIDVTLLIINFWRDIISLWYVIISIGIVVILLWIFIIISRLGIDKDIDRIELKPQSPKIHSWSAPYDKIGLTIEIENKALRKITPQYVYLKAYLNNIEMTTFMWQNIFEEMHKNNKKDINVRGMEDFQKNAYIDVEFTPPRYMYNDMVNCQLEGIIIFKYFNKELPPKIIKYDDLSFNISKENREHFKKKVK